MKMGVRIKKLNANAKVPTYSSLLASGADLYACMGSDIVVPAGETVMIHTGVAIEIPMGCAGLIFARSGLAVNEGLAPANKVGVIDADYRGEIMVAMYNHSEWDAVVNDGERIAQLVITPMLRADFEVVDKLEETERGSRGFGSTGKL